MYQFAVVGKSIQEDQRERTGNSTICGVEWMHTGVIPSSRYSFTAGGCRSNGSSIIATASGKKIHLITFKVAAGFENVALLMILLLLYWLWHGVYYLCTNIKLYRKGMTPSLWKVLRDLFS